MSHAFDEIAPKKNLKMFALLDRHLPHVEDKIISYLGPADLIRSKKVSKKWDAVIQRRIDFLKMSKTSDTDTIHQLLQDILNEARIIVTSTYGSYKLCSWLTHGIANIVAYPMAGSLGEYFAQWVKDVTEKSNDDIEGLENYRLCYKIHPGRGCLCLVDKDTTEDPLDSGRPLLGLISTAEGLRIASHNYTLAYTLVHTLVYTLAYTLAFTD